MTAEATEQSEPTMEEILASIRKIIATEGAPAQADEEVLELTEEVIDVVEVEIVEPPAPEPVAAPIVEELVIESVDSDELIIESTEPEVLEAPPVEAVVPVPEAEALVSADATDVAATSFSHLEEKLLQQRASLGSHVEMGDGKQTLEHLITEIMRPLLKEWLDNNLPATVERLVKSEIERIARRHGD